MPTPKTTLFALALAIPGGLGLAAAVPDRDPLRQQAFEEAVRTSQRRLARGMDLWQDHTTWNDPFTFETPSYSLATTYSGRLASYVAQGLEGMIPTYQGVLGSDFQPEAAYPVRIYPGLEEYNVFGGDHGADDSSVLGAFYASGAPTPQLAVMAHSSETQVLMWATHAATLHYLDGAFDRNPPLWVSRGLASYFSHLWDFTWAVQQLKHYREQGSYVPLRQVVQENLAGYRTGPGADVRFCELAVFFTYLLNYREDTRNTVEADGSVTLGPFAEYLRVYLDGGNPRRHPLNDQIVDRLEEVEQDFLAFDFGV